MTDPDLIRRAEAAGVAPIYLDWRGQRVEVSEETLTAILGALDRVPGVPSEAGGPDGVGGADAGTVAGVVGEVGVAGEAGEAAEIGVAGEAGAPSPRLPEGRSWGFTVQLYSVRSRNSWGHGDLHDLADLARWSARDLGAGFVLINPLHAAQPLPPVSPTSR
jgi:4-alpha-glucanotransferase